MWSFSLYLPLKSLKEFQMSMNVWRVQAPAMALQLATTQLEFHCSCPFVTSFAKETNSCANQFISQDNGYEENQGAASTYCHKRVTRNTLFNRGLMV
ncbi:hypothetical protein ZWY2020_057828 [Hordeum vulgare]|nr:hypothetical protein ZWY2020_057828 [Hordeum vulgare]